VHIGRLKLQFPKPTIISAIHIHASASPTSNETYTITADAVATIGSATRRVVAGTAGSTLEPIPVIPGTYSAITITVNGGSSWVQIFELTFINDACPLE
jgi:hypothetical protein